MGGSVLLNKRDASLQKFQHCRAALAQMLTAGVLKCSMPSTCLMGAADKCMRCHLCNAQVTGQFVYDKRFNAGYWGQLIFTTNANTNVTVSRVFGSVLPLLLCLVASRASASNSSSGACSSSSGSLSHGWSSLAAKERARRGKQSHIIHSHHSQ